MEIARELVSLEVLRFLNALNEFAHLSIIVFFTDHIESSDHFPHLI